MEKQAQGIRLEAGEGIGRVTKPGLDQPVGEAAINSVPRKMILAAAEAVCAETGYDGGLKITLSVPGGEEIAKRTFNPQLGIEGGISILGTSGIVEPMSEQAVVDTIALEIRQAAAGGAKGLILTPGNYGMDFLREKLPQLQGIPAAKCSNFIGDAIDIAVTEGFSESVSVTGSEGRPVSESEVKLPEVCVSSEPTEGPVPQAVREKIIQRRRKNVKILRIIRTLLKIIRDGQKTSPPLLYHISEYGAIVRLHKFEPVSLAILHNYW